MLPGVVGIAVILNLEIGNIDVAAASGVPVHIQRGRPCRARRQNLYGHAVGIGADQTGVEGNANFGIQHARSHATEVEIDIQ